MKSLHTHKQTKTRKGCFYAQLTGKEDKYILELPYMIVRFTTVLNFGKNINVTSDDRKQELDHSFTRPFHLHSSQIVYSKYLLSSKPNFQSNWILPILSQLFIANHFHYCTVLDLLKCTHTHFCLQICINLKPYICKIFSTTCKSQNLPSTQQSLQQEQLNKP